MGRSTPASLSFKDRKLENTTIKIPLNCDDQFSHRKEIYCPEEVNGFMLSVTCLVSYFPLAVWVFLSSGNFSRAQARWRLIQQSQINFPFSLPYF